MTDHGPPGHTTTAPSRTPSRSMDQAARGDLEMGKPCDPTTKGQRQIDKALKDKELQLNIMEVMRQAHWRANSEQP